MESMPQVQELARAAPSRNQYSKTKSTEEKGDFQKKLKTCIEEDQKTDTKVDKDEPNEVLATSLISAVIMQQIQLQNPQPVDETTVQTDQMTTKTNNTLVSILTGGPLVKDYLKFEGETSESDTNAQVNSIQVTNKKDVVFVVPQMEGEDANGVQETETPQNINSLANLKNTSENKDDGQIELNLTKSSLEKKTASLDDKYIFLTNLKSSTSATTNILDLQKVPEQLRSLELVRKLSQQISDMSQINQTSMHLQVWPENMGKIDLHLVSKSDGIQVILRSDSQETQRMLESNLGQLQNALRSAGVQIGGMSVSTQSSSQQNFDFFRNRNQSQNVSQITSLDELNTDNLKLRYTQNVYGFDYSA